MNPVQEKKSEVKEPRVAVKVTIDGGMINVDSPEDSQADINQQILQAMAVLKERSVTTAKVKLTFSYATTA